MPSRATAVTVATFRICLMFVMFVCSAQRRVRRRHHGRRRHRHGHRPPRPKADRHRHRWLERRHRPSVVPTRGLTRRGRLVRAPDHCWRLAAHCRGWPIAHSAAPHRGPRSACLPRGQCSRSPLAAGPYRDWRLCARSRAEPLPASTPRLCMVCDARSGWVAAGILAAVLLAITRLIFVVQVLPGRVATPIGRVAAIRGIVIPVRPIAVGVDLPVGVDVVVAVDVDVHVAPAPVAAAPQCIADADADAPGDAGGNRPLTKSSPPAADSSTADTPGTAMRPYTTAGLYEGT